MHGRMDWTGTTSGCLSFVPCACAGAGGRSAAEGIHAVGPGGSRVGREEPVHDRELLRQRRDHRDALGREHAHDTAPVKALVALAFLVGDEAVHSGGVAGAGVALAVDLGGGWCGAVVWVAQAAVRRLRVDRDFALAGLVEVPKVGLVALHAVHAQQLGSVAEEVVEAAVLA